MYSIKAKNAENNEFYVYRDDLPDSTLKLVNPKLDLTENSAGQLTFKMTPNNVGYDQIDQITTLFTVYLQGEEIWCGRIISVKEDFQKNKTITCEGELAYLNDTTQPQELYSDKSYGQLLEIFLTEHNNKVDISKKVYLGEYTPYNVDTEAYSEVYTNYDTTWAAINDKILSNYNGYIKFYRYAGRNLIDLIPKNRRPISTQVIKFGTNLLDFTKNFDSTQFCTVVVPLGAKLEDKYGINMSGIEGVQAYTTVEDAPVDEYHRSESLYVYRQDMVDAYGWIEEVVHFDDEENPELLLNKAKEYLDSIQYDMMTLEVSALDLTYLDVDYERLKLSDSVRVVSKIHGLDKNFPITKMSIPLDNPANTTYTMGLTATSTMTKRTTKTLGDLTDDLRDTPSIDAVLYQARKEAHELIGGFTTGYITITQMQNGSNELYVTDEPIPEDYNASNPTGNTNVQKYWRWNLNGLEFVNKTVDPDAPLLALDMQGRINASMVNTGILNAGIIQAGILKNVDWGQSSTFYPVQITFSSSSATEGSFDYVRVYVYDSENNVYRYTANLCSGQSNLAGNTIRIPNDEFYIYWYTDSSNDNYYGWSISSANIYNNMTENTKWTDFPNTTSSLPTRNNTYYCTSASQMQSAHSPYGNNVRDLFDCSLGLYPNKNAKNVFYLDLEHGVLKMNASELTIAGTSSKGYISDITNGVVSNYDKNTLTQQGVFNKLTNNGTLQGIFMQNGQLYINASYLATGVLQDQVDGTKFYLNLNNGTLRMNATSLSISGSSVATQNYADTAAGNAETNAKGAIDSKISYYDTYTLTQTKVFNKLTNNGVLQGLYMQNGYLYINASYINTGSLSADRIYGGTLKLGGAYGYGSLSLYDANTYSPNLLYSLSYPDGLVAYSTSYSGYKITAKYAYSGYLNGDLNIPRNHLASGIAYYMQNYSNPYAFIGVGSSGENPRLMIRNSMSSISLSASGALSLYSDSRIEIDSMIRSGGYDTQGDVLIRFRGQGQNNFQLRFVNGIMVSADPGW